MGRFRREQPFLFRRRAKVGLARDLGDRLQSRNVPLGTSVIQTEVKNEFCTFARPYGIQSSGWIE